MINNLKAISSDKIYLISYLLIVVTLPFPTFANNLCVIFLVVIWILLRGYKNIKRRLLTKPLFLLFIAYYALYVIGMIYTDNINAGLSILEKNIPLLVFPLIFGSIDKISKSHFEIILKVFIATSVITCLICLVAACYKNFLEGYSLISIIKGFQGEIEPYRYRYFNYWYFTYDFLTSPLGIQPMYLALFLGFSICLCIYFLIRSEKIKSVYEKWFYYFSTLLILLVIMLLSVRILLVALGIFFFLFVAYLILIKKKYVISIIIIALMASLSYLVMYLNPITKQRIVESINLSQTDYKKDNWGGRAFRIEKWRNSLMIINKNLIFGVGSGDGQDHLNAMYLENNFVEGIGYNSHNEYLKITLELGLIGLILFLSILLIPVKLSFKIGSYLFIFFILLISIFFITENVLSRRMGIVFYAFFNSLFTHYYFYRFDSKYKKPSQPLPPTVPPPMQQN